MPTDSRRLSQRKPHKPLDVVDEPLHCDLFDCASRLLVRSESRPDIVHLVDLNSDDRGRFECSCEDWHFRNPDWIVAPIPYECKHIFRAKQFILTLADRIIEDEKKREKYRNAPGL